MRNALLHPFGLTLLIASLVLVGLMLLVLDRWWRQALWIFLLGLLAYAACAVVIHRWRTSVVNPADSTDTNLGATEDEGGRRELPARFVDEALRHLYDLAFLAQCELVSLLPRTLAAVPSPEGADRTSDELTHLESAQALHHVLITAIEQLRPLEESVGVGSSRALQYHILHEAYVQRRPVAYILTGYNIGEATYFRTRRTAVSAVARHLQSQEDRIKSEQFS